MRLLILIAAITAEVLPLIRTGYGLGGKVVVRCGKGHLFTTFWLPGGSIKSVRIAAWRLQRCPVAHHWSLVTPVRRDSLSADELDAASKTTDSRLP